MSERFKAASLQQNQEMQNLSQESELISKYQPTLIGYGYDHYVYEAEGHPNSVIKINRESIRYALRYCLQGNGSMDDYCNDEGIQKEINKWMDYFKQRQQEIQQYFGAEHCPSSRFIKMKIPTIPSFYAGMQIEDPATIPDELLVLATVQERVIDNFTEDDSVHTWYIKDDPDAYAYTDYTTSALTDPHGPLARPKRPDIFDEKTRVVIQDFIERAIQYTNGTGHILDLNGVNNLVLTHEEDGALSYKLLDALFPATNWDQVITEVKTLIERRIEDHDFKIAESDKVKIKTVANYVRFINELANASGSTARLDTLATSDEKMIAAFKRILLDMYTEVKSNQNLTQK